MIRAFLALPLPDTLIHRLTVLQHGLRLTDPVPRENLHLTLVFLGEQREPDLEDLHIALDNRRLEAPQLQLTGLDVFGGQMPRNLHATFALTPGLKALQSKVTQLARHSNIAIKARKFVPHVTLARFAEGEASAPELAARIQQQGAVHSDPYLIPEMVMFRSILRASGPVYDPLASYPLLP
ncbi:RNA 2',3'-cyclic phosphodiesterase [Pararhodobacter oceanensis]|uniref:RNA 2',3'-cyclic phosphodiesterase n=1 Tax=Pararhodobacter oceanensis TaxID=2172121 RepID=UPI003A95B251